MTTFVYEAARPDGARLRGRLDAADRGAAADLLSRRGLLPLSLRTPRMAAWARWRRVPLRSQAALLQGLSSLVNAGVPLQKALVVAGRSTHGAMREVVERLEARVREGAALGAALAAEQGVFSPVTIGLVRAGERGLGMAAALDGAAGHLEREAELNARVRAALAYPLVLLCVGTVSIATIVMVVVPRFVRILGDVGASLPAASRALVATSLTLSEHGLAVAVVGVIALAIVVHMVATRPDQLHELAIGLPLIGPLRHGLATARGGRTLAALLRAGVPALVALDAARETVGDRAVTRRLASARPLVAEGASLSQALRSTAAFTPATLEMTALGEGTGRLADLLERAAAIEDREAERRVRALVAVLEPALILGFAVVVAFVAAALLQALYSLRPA